MAVSAEIIDLTTASPKEIIDIESGSEDGQITVSQTAVESSQLSNDCSKPHRVDTPRSPAPERVTANRNEGAHKQENRKRRRERDRKHDRDQERSRNRHRSSSPKRRRSETPHRSVADLFYVDLTPVTVPPNVKLDSTTETSCIAELNTSTVSSKDSEPKLLLPPHVTVFDGSPVEILASTQVDSEAKGFIEYLDYDGDDDKGTRRYFEESVDEAEIPVKYTCKQCKGDHRTSECTTIICLTCGVRNEHPTRRCPISKVCFRCKLTGHISSECNNRYQNSSSDCDRCGSIRHQTKECPSIWRQYDYVANDEKDHILTWRAERSELPLGQGGEGYIADDAWCYNCGDSGHWGDDCQRKRARECPDEPSAFGIYNTMSGPFATDSPSAPGSSMRRKERDWEDPTRIEGRLPANVGAQGRKKERVRMARAARVEVDNDDDQDWFSGARRQAERSSQKSQRGQASGSRPSGDEQKDDKHKRKKKKRSTNTSTSDGIRDESNARDSKSSSRSLMERLDGGSSLLKGVYHERTRRERRRDQEQNDGPTAISGRDKDRHRNRERDRPRDWEKEYERNRDKDRPRHDGPRYRGGYRQ